MGTYMSANLASFGLIFMCGSGMHLLRFSAYYCLLLINETLFHLKKHVSLFLFVLICVCLTCAFIYHWIFLSNLGSRSFHQRCYLLDVKNVQEICLNCQHIYFLLTYNLFVHLCSFYELLCLYISILLPLINHDCVLKW